jgi:hypothetical protein
MPGAADDGREDGTGGVVSGEAGLAHAGAVVNDQSSNLVVTHLDLWVDPCFSNGNCAQNNSK